MREIVEYILGICLDKEPAELQTRKGFILYAIGRNMVFLLVLLLWLALILLAFVKGNYVVATFFACLILFPLFSIYSWNQEAVKHWKKHWS